MNTRVQSEWVLETKKAFAIRRSYKRKELQKL
jgi:hypothetical protein